MSNWNILVIEDDPDGQEVVSRILRHHNLQPSVVGTAEEALVVLQQADYIAAVIDLALPGMDGWHLLHEIRSIPYLQNLPCVAITAYHSAEVAVDAIDAGFDAYFPKPLDPTSFVRELERVINA
ncbi:MAG: response regulator [Anaerolineales bacterium]|nr:response regulator [Anaerolineales bacterium]